MICWAVTRLRTDIVISDYMDVHHVPYDQFREWYRIHLGNYLNM